MDQEDLNLTKIVGCCSALGSELEQLRKHHALEAYEPAPTKSHNGGECLAKAKGKFIECYEFDDLDMYAHSLLCDIKVYNVVTIDLEGLTQDKSRDLIIPDGIVVGALGGACYYFHVTDLIVQSAPFDDTPLTTRTRIERFAKVFRFIEDILTEPKYVKLGSGLSQDVDVFLRLFPGLTKADLQNVLDTALLVKRMRRQGVYKPQAAERMGNRTGIPILSSLHSGMDYKCYGQRAKGSAWASLPWFRKISGTPGSPGTCPMFIWIEKPLKEYQCKYVYNDVQVILLALIDYVHFAVQSKWIGCCFGGSLVGKTAYLLDEVYGFTFRRHSVYSGKFVPKYVETIDLTLDEDQPALNLHLPVHKKPQRNSLAPSVAAAATNEDPSREIVEIEEESIQINASNDKDLLGNVSAVSDSTAVSEQPQVPSKVVVVRPVATSTPVLRPRESSPEYRPSSSGVPANRKRPADNEAESGPSGRRKRLDQSPNSSEHGKGVCGVEGSPCDGTVQRTRDPTRSDLPTPLPCPTFSGPDDAINLIGDLYTGREILLIEKALNERRSRFGDWDARTPTTVLAALTEHVSPEHLVAVRERIDGHKPRTRSSRGQGNHLGNKVFRRVQNRQTAKFMGMIEEERLPVFLSDFPLLLFVDRCQDCGLGHMHGAEECPIMLVHGSQHVLAGVPEGFFKLWPCGYCGSVYHTLAVCEKLHSFCDRCDERGHLQVDCAGVQAMSKDLRRQRFGLFAKYGILTGRMPAHFGFERVTIARDDWDGVHEECIEAARTYDASNLYNE